MLPGRTHFVRVSVTWTPERRADLSINEGTVCEYGGLAVHKKSVIKCWQQLKAVGLLLVVIDEHYGFVGLDDLSDLFQLIRWMLAYLY